MEIDIQTIIITITSVIGSLKLIFHGLEGLVKLTKTKKDDNFVNKVNKILEEFTKFVGYCTMHKK